MKRIASLLAALVVLGLLTLPVWATVEDIPENQEEMDTVSTYKMPSGPSPYRYLTQGIPLFEMMPIQDAIMENLRFARKHGYLLFAVLMAIWLVPTMLRRVFGTWGETHYLDTNQPGVNSSYEKNAETGAIERKEKPKNKRKKA